MRNGVTHCIDCRAEFDDAPLFAGNPNISYLWNGVRDDGIPKPTIWFQKSLDFALSALASPRHKVYAHCLAGRNRGPSTAFAIMLALGWLPQDARDLIKKNRPVAGIAYAADAERAIKELGY